MLDFLGEEFLLWFNERRKKRNIPLKTIWGHKKSQVKTHIFAEDKKNVARRHLTGKNAASMSYIIYDNKVAFISSQKESFGFIIESTEFTELQRMQFDVLWSSLKK